MHIKATISKMCHEQIPCTKLTEIVNQWKRNTMLLCRLVNQLAFKLSGKRHGGARFRLCGFLFNGIADKLYIYTTDRHAQMQCIVYVGSDMKIEISANITTS